MSIAATQSRPSAGQRRAAARFAVHVGLATSFVAALVPLLIFSLADRNTVHVVIACVFLALAVVHLAQRRRTLARLAAQLLRPSRGKGQRRLIRSDLVLAFLVTNVLASGIWDYADGGVNHKVPGLGAGPGYHAISSALLLCYLAGHVLRRRRRFRSSTIR